MLGEWQLYDEAVDGIVVIELIHFVEQFLLADRVLKANRG